MDTFKKILERIADTFIEESKKELKGNKIAFGIRHAVPEALKRLANIDDQYKVYASPGSGNWSEIPWIAILDKEVTTTTQNGYYIDYLFTGDMSAIYLTLGLGWTQFETKYGIHEGRNQIKNYASVFSKNYCLL